MAPAIWIDNIKSFGRRILDRQSRILIKNSSWVFLENFIRTILTFTRSIIVARGLGVELYGVFAIIVAFVGTIQEFFNLNIGTTIIKFGAEFKAKNRADMLFALVKSCIYITLITSVSSILMLVLVLLIYQGDLFGIPNISALIILYGCVFGTSFFDSISSSLLRLHFKFKLNSFIRMITALIDFLLVILAVILFPKNFVVFLSAVIVAKLISVVINNGMAWWELRRDLQPYYKTKIRILFARIKEIAGFTVGNSFSRTLKILVDRGDTLILGILMGPIQVGYYTVAKKLAYSVYRIADPLSSAIFPQLAVLINNKKTKEVKAMLAKVTRIGLIYGGILLVLSYLFKERVMLFLYGPDFLSSSFPFFILLIASVAGSVFFWNLSLIQSLGLIKLRVYTYFFSGLIFLLLSVILVPKSGATGMAISLVIYNWLVIIRFTSRGMKALQ